MPKTWLRACQVEVVCQVRWENISLFDSVFSQQHFSQKLLKSVKDQTSYSENKKEVKVFEIHVVHGLEVSEMPVF